MSEEEIDKWFIDNGLHWVTEWVGLRYDINGKPYSVKTEIWDGKKKVIEWYSQVEKISERWEKANKYLLSHRRDIKLKELGI